VHTKILLAKSFGITVEETYSKAMKLLSL